MIDVLVAGTDGIYLSRAGAKRLGLMRAISGTVIALPALGMVYFET